MASYSEKSNAAAFENQEEEEEDADLRRGPWTLEEDHLLVSYITNHGEGRWNSLAHSAGLKRTGKSCRLRWLNYLRPDVRRGNISPEEQLLILELHSRWGNRWSKIAQHLPGRTDNEIKNYWRTRVQKHAKQMKCDVNSKQFRDAMRYLWMPRLMEQIHATRAGHVEFSGNEIRTSSSTESWSIPEEIRPTNQPADQFQMNHHPTVCASSNYVATTPSDSTSAVSDSADYYCLPEFAPETQITPVVAACSNYDQAGNSNGYMNQIPDQLLQSEISCWMDTNDCGGDFCENLWSSEDFWFLQQQLCNTF